MSILFCFFQSANIQRICGNIICASEFCLRQSHAYSKAPLYSLACAGEDNVGVRVAECRQNHTSFSVNDFICLILRAAVHRAERGDPFTVNENPRIVQRAGLAHFLAVLANGLLKGKALSDFIARSQKVVSDAYLK